ncbi:MAG: hypothetical protein ACRDK4_05095 [Solirubrobacteraceae bacterium]
MSLIEIPPMTEPEIRALLANCEFGEALFEAMTVPEKQVPSPRDTARAKLEATLLQAQTASFARWN